MILSPKYICSLLFVLCIILNATSAGRRRKACDGSKNEVYSSCGNPCKQMTCNDRILGVTTKTCNTACHPGCICKQDYVRRNQTTDPCVLYC